MLHRIEVLSLKRREFVGLLGGLIAGWPLTGHAQQQRMPVIGILVLGNPDPTEFVRVIREELLRLGYVEGRNCRYEVRSAGGREPQLAELAAELVRLPVNILITWLTPPSIAARDATKDLPIVVASAGDPVATGLVASLARPGGNITGTSAIAAEIMSKNVELIREAIPSASRIGVFANPLDLFTQPFLNEIEAAAKALDINLEKVMGLPSDDPEPHFRSLRDKKVDALIIQPTLIRPGIAELAQKYQLPSITMIPSFARSGGLMAYGANGPALWKQGALYVDRILKGERPADLPVLQPTNFDLVINLKAAKALGLELPSGLVARANDVIE
jgi:putative tryptophan/tyrosine transport system substrate-binding protein